jgi:Asp-tRNA(Asn)/Glu-tRNA(Gln) amidotransferase A subunit family amidase
MPIRRSLLDLASLIRRRDLSPVEVVQTTLKQIERMNPSINAFMEVCAEEALVAARAAEGLLMKGLRAEEALPPLLGVPLSLKDCFDLAGHATRTGSLLREHEMAHQDSWAAARFQAAGAVIVGKTSTPEFLMNYETDNAYIGRTNNPWNLERTSGGSSGGEAAAIASFCSAGGIGSDGGGSIREPAHFCGICGLKPTPGRVPLTGHWPVSGHPTGFMGVGGPMARTAADVRALFEVLAGDDPGDPFSVPLPLSDGSGGPRLPRRVAILEQYGDTPVQPAVREAVRTAATLLGEMGIEVVPFDFGLMRGSHELWRYFFVDVLNVLLRALIDGREDRCHWTGLELIDTVKGQAPPSMLDLVIKLGERDAMRAKLLAGMRETPILLMPGFGVTAFPHRQRVFSTPQGDITLMDAIRLVSPWNLFGMPSMTVPVSFDADGMPAGVQFVGLPWSEETLLELAVRFEEARCVFPSPPLGTPISRSTTIVA